MLTTSFKSKRFVLPPELAIQAHIRGIEVELQNALNSWLNALLALHSSTSTTLLDALLTLYSALTPKLDLLRPSTRILCRQPKFASSQQQER